MQIAIDIRLIGKSRTGDEAVFFNLTKELIRIDQENAYLLLTDRQDEEFLIDLKQKLGLEGKTDRVKLISLQGKNRFIWNLVSVPLFLALKQPDVFHTQYILPAFIPKKTKLFTHIHDVSFRAFPKLIGWKDRLFLSLFIPRTMKQSDFLVVPSEFTKEEVAVRYGVDPARIVVVPNALSSEFLEPFAEADLDRVRERHHLPRTFLLSVGTLQPRKNLPMLIRAFAKLKARLPDISLVLVGNRAGHHYDRGIDQALKEGGVSDSVMFPGFVEAADLPIVYRLADGLVFPSRYEGFGIPLLEAFSVGTPVAASDIPPFREVGGSAALYFPAEGIDICSETLYTLLTNEKERGRCKDAGKERVRMYSWENSARLLLSSYISAAGGSDRS